MIWAFDVHFDDPQYAREFSKTFFTVGLSYGVLMRPIGTTVYLMPPYILDDAHIRFLGDAVFAVLSQVLATLR